MTFLLAYLASYVGLDAVEAPLLGASRTPMASNRRPHGDEEGFQPSSNDELPAWGKHLHRVRQVQLSVWEVCGFDRRVGAATPIGQNRQVFDLGVDPNSCNWIPYSVEPAEALLWHATECDFAEIARCDAAGMLRIYLKADTLHMRGPSSVGPCVIGSHVAAFGSPAVEGGRSRLTDHRDDSHKRKRAGVRHRAFRGRSIPDIREDAPVGKGHENLGRLIVAGRVAEVATGGKLAHFPSPSQIRHFRWVYVDGSFQREGGFYAFQVDAAVVVVPAAGDLRPPAIPLNLPAGGHPVAIPVR